MMVRPDWREPLAWLGGWVPSREHVDKGKFKKKKKLTTGCHHRECTSGEEKKLDIWFLFIRKSGGGSPISVSKTTTIGLKNSVVNKEPN